MRQLCFLLLLWSSTATAESPYEDLRQRLKNKDPESSQIISGSIIRNDEPQTLVDVTEEKKAACRKKSKSPECAEYYAITDKRNADEICARDPLSKKCERIRDRLAKYMHQRQSYCRGGLELKKCRRARKIAKRQGLLD